MKSVLGWERGGCKCYNSGPLNPTSAAFHQGHYVEQLVTRGKVFVRRWGPSNKKSDEETTQSETYRREPVVLLDDMVPMVKLATAQLPNTSIPVFLICSRLKLKVFKLSCA